jgi:hypothetical protein
MKRRGFGVRKDREKRPSFPDGSNCGLGARRTTEANLATQLFSRIRFVFGDGQPIGHPDISGEQSAETSRRVDATIFMRDLDCEIAWAVHDYSVPVHYVCVTLVARKRKSQ